MGKQTEQQRRNERKLTFPLCLFNLPPALLNDLPRHVIHTVDIQLDALAARLRVRDPRITKKIGIPGITGTELGLRLRNDLVHAQHVIDVAVCRRQLTLALTAFEVLVTLVLQSSRNNRQAWRNMLKPNGLPEPEYPRPRKFDCSNNRRAYPRLTVFSSYPSAPSPRKR